MAAHLTSSYRVGNANYKSAITSRFALRKGRSLDANHLQVYKYRPLRNPSTHIRLLYLLPRSCKGKVAGERSIACELISYQVEQAPAYIGLSYTWGNGSSRRPIAIAGRVLHITEALFIALEHQREANKTLIMWVDAICINQVDGSEKSRQVQQMGRIFSGAAMVLAWLGTAADDSDLVLQHLSKIRNKTDETIKTITEAEFSHGLLV